MSDKTGKNFSLPTRKAAKSSLKSKEAKGKDDSARKSNSGRKVQFDSVDSPRSGGKGDAPTSFPKGKGDKSSDGKSKTVQPLELKLEDELPNNVRCLMACEAADLLQGIQHHMTVLSKDPSIKTPISLENGLRYAERGSHYSDPKSVRQLLETLTKNGVTEGEICVIADICPETAEEALALVPSLKAKNRVLKEHLQEVLTKLVTLKQPMSNPKI